MCIQMFNISVDAPDGHTDALKEDLSINEMESVLEIILEQCLDIENAIPEYDEEDDNNSNSIGKYFIQFYFNGQSISINNTTDILLLKKVFPPAAFLLCEYNPEKVTPPPKC